MRLTLRLALGDFPLESRLNSRNTVDAKFVRLRSALARGTRAGPLGAEEEARPVVRVVEQLKLELVALDPPHRQ